MVTVLAVRGSTAASSVMVMCRCAASLKVTDVLLVYKLQTCC